MLAFLLAALQPAPAAPPSPGEIAAAAPASEWVEIAAHDLLVMELAPDAAGRGRRVIIQLTPAPISEGWVGNIRQLARAGWWDGTSVNRVQDNYVAQWGDATERKPLPPGLRRMAESDYVRRQFAADTVARGVAGPAEGDVKDVYAPVAFFQHGWPMASDWETVWPVHCYASVGVGRNLSPDTGTGAELYAVIGHAPRHLDRNIAVVGRVIEGIEQLSSLPRGTEALGFYADEGERVPILRIRLAADLPAPQRPRFQQLRTGPGRFRTLAPGEADATPTSEESTFDRYVRARQNREPPFFIRPAGGADICNIPVPVRRAL